MKRTPLGLVLLIPLAFGGCDQIEDLIGDSTPITIPGFGASLENVSLSNAAIVTLDNGDQTFSGDVKLSLEGAETHTLTIESIVQSAMVGGKTTLTITDQQLDQVRSFAYDPVLNSIAISSDADTVTLVGHADTTLTVNGELAEDTDAAISMMNASHVFASVSPHSLVAAYLLGEGIPTLACSSYPYNSCLGSPAPRPTNPPPPASPPPAPVCKPAYGEVCLNLTKCALSKSGACELFVAARYPFEGSAKDTGGFRKHATLVAGGSLVDHALTLDEGAYAEATHTQLPQGAAPRTVSLWFKTTATATWASLFNYGTAANGQRFGVLLNDGKVYFAGQGADVGGGTVAVADGKWHHVAVTYDGTTLQVWLDGAKAQSGTPALNTTGQVLRIGASVGEPQEKFDGAIDDVRIYNQNLTEGAIKAFFTQGRSQG